MTGSILDWDTTAANNASADAAINWQENQSPDTVNDSARQMMGRIAEWIKDRTPQRNSTGAANIYAVTSASSPASLKDGFEIAFKAHQSNTGAAQIAVNSFGNKPLRSRTGTSLTANEILSGAAILAQYNQAADEFLIVGGRIGGSSADTLARITPIGVPVPWPGDTLPAGYLWANGAAVSRSGYAELFAVYGTKYGVGDGTTTFNLPDYKGRTPFGADNMGATSAANRLTTAGSGIDGTTLGATGGAENVTLTTSHMPDMTTGSESRSHNHTFGRDVGSNYISYSGGASTSPNWLIAGTATTDTTNNASQTHTHTFTGGKQAHTNMPPAIVQNWIILAKPDVAAAANLGVNGYYYQWSTVTSDTDPGTGKLGFNNSTLSSATTLFISETDQPGNGMASVLANWGVSTSSTKGKLYIYKVGNLTTFCVFNVTSTVTDGGSYDKFTVSYLASSGTFAAGDQLSVIFTPQGDKGDTGPTGADGGVKFTFDASTTMGAPSAGGFRVDNATLGSVTNFAISNASADTGNPSVLGWIAAWGDSTTTTDRGQIIIRKAVPSNNILILRITGAVTNNSTWLTASVQVLQATGSFSNGDAILISFSRSGNKGLDGAGSGTVTSITAGAGLSSTGVGGTGGSLTVSGTLTNVEAVNAQSGTSYTLLSGDHAKLVTFNNSSAQAVTLPQATGSFGAGWYCDIANINSGVVTITPTTSTINGATSFVLGRFQSVRIVSDGTNYQVAQGIGIRGATTTVASASTCDIGATASDFVSITGTTTITSLGSVPNQVRFGTFASILTFTHNASSLILPNAGSNITTAAGDTFIARSDSSGNWRILSYTKADGTSLVGSGGGGGGGNAAYVNNLTLVPSVAGSALTIAVKTAANADPSGGDPISVVFRSATASSGSYDSVSITSALSVAVSSGSTLGTTSNIPFKVWVVLFNDGGTARLGVINCLTGKSIYPLAASALASSTAEGGSGAADNAQTFYTGTAVSAKAYVVLGYLEWSAGLGTAGTWNTGPTVTRLFGPDVRLPGTEFNQQINTYTSTVTTTSTSFTSTGITVAITPTSAANLIMVGFAGAGDCDAVNNTVFYDADRAGTSICGVYGRDALSSAVKATSGAGTIPQSFMVTDAPASTSSLTYTLKWKVTSGTATLGARNGGANTAVTTFYVKEIQV